jgi:F-type H+-transporting ATPase subunit c
MVMNKFLLALLAVVVSGAAFAQDGGMTTLIPMNEYTKIPMYFLAVAFAAFAGTRAQSAAASVALEGMARNPAAADKLFVPMILGLALMESLVIFTLITIFLV